MHRFLHHERKFRRGVAAGPSPGHRTGLLEVDHAIQRGSGRKLRSLLPGLLVERRMGGAVGEKNAAVEMRVCGVQVGMKTGIGGCVRHRLMEPGDRRKVGRVLSSPKMTGGAAMTGIVHHQSPDLRRPLRLARWHPLPCPWIERR